MGSNSSGEEEATHHSIKIGQVNEDLIKSMQRKISETKPRLLNKSAGRSSCCIFRVPQSLIEINGRAYHPHIVSIGPYHHGQPHLHMIQEHKWRFLGTLLNRTQTHKDLSLVHYLNAVKPLEGRSRECYSETVHFNSDEFIEILVLDGCFIIELFRKISGLVPFEAGDPFISMSWIYSFFLRDLIRLENQIPFFVLQCLFELTQLPGEEENGPTLSALSLQFFNNALQRPNEVIGQYYNYQGKHLLDLLRSSFIPHPHPHQEHKPKHVISASTHLIQNVSKLRRAGINLKVGHVDSFLILKFKHGVIEMPTIAIDDFMCSFLLNCVAFEQCHRGISKHFTTYATLVDCLINTQKDVEYLCDRNILENYFGTDAEVAKFINNLGKDVTFDIDQCYLTGLFNDVNEHYHNGWHVQWASFRYTYFDTPWSFISALAALILLLLTVAQTFFTIISYTRPRP